MLVVKPNLILRLGTKTFSIMKKVLYIVAATLIVSVSAGFVLKSNQPVATNQQTPSAQVNSNSEIGQIESNPARWD